MGPYFRGAEYYEAFKATGPLRNMIPTEDYVKNTYAPRHVQCKLREDFLLAELSKAAEKDGVPVIVHPSIEAARSQDWYMWYPVYDGFVGINNPFVVSRMDTLHRELEKWKHDFHQKVS